MLQHDGQNETLTRDLSLGGAVLLGVGAKQLLLPAFALSHPLLLAVTVPTTLITGRHYLSSLWQAARGKAPVNADVLAGGATAAALVSGGAVTALAGVSVFNLGKYLTQKFVADGSLQEQEHESSEPSAPPSWPHSFTHYAIPASLAAGGLIFAPHFINLLPSVGTSLAVTNQLVGFLRSNPYAPLFYIGAYTLAPLLFFPASLLTVSSGVLFGPYWGLLYAIVGSVASAMMAYLIGRYLAQRVGVNLSPKQDFVQRYADWMRENPFESTLTMHILYLPYDLVNYLAGAVEIEIKPFLLGTMLGSLPGSVSFVLLGASIKGSAINGIPTLNPMTLAASGVIFVGSLALSRHFKEKADMDAPPKQEEQEGLTGQLGLA